MAKKKRPATPLDARLTEYLEPELAAVTPRDRRPHTVLVIDDDPRVHDMLTAELTEGGHVVAHASNGLEGVNVLDALDPPPSLILLDLVMPKYDGLTFQHFVRHCWAARIPILYISGYTSQQLDQEHAGDPNFIHVHRAIRDGRYITKPWSREHLLEVVRIHAEKGRARAQETKS